MCRGWLERGAPQAPPSQEDAVKIKQEEMADFWSLLYFWGEVGGVVVFPKENFYFERCLGPGLQRQQAFVCFFCCIKWWKGCDCW